ncbi:MAG: desulfoferrodoxin [Treponemataceae bacterium]|nr:desulfoferrodoxin [Treponemataceae bacterium]
MQLNFFVCRHCGKIIAIVKDSGVPTICCGEAMEELVPGVTDGALEKHVPVIRVNGNTVTVTVGSKLHPTLAEHYIEWILLQTDKGIQQKWLGPGDKPEVDFAILMGERVQAAYEYCNIHKLWRTNP